MTTHLKGILWVLLAVVLLAGSQKAHADSQAQFMDIMDGKQLIHRGTCRVDNKGNIANTAVGVSDVLCQAGVNPDDPEYHFVVIYTSRGEAERIILLDPKTMDQTTIWRNGKEL